jgi:hypothetical protein
LASSILRFCASIAARSFAFSASTAFNFASSALLGSKGAAVAFSDAFVGAFDAAPSTLRLGRFVALAVGTVAFVPVDGLNASTPRSQVALRFGGAAAVATCLDFVASLVDGAAVASPRVHVFEGMRGANCGGQNARNASRFVIHVDITACLARDVSNAMYVQHVIVFALDFDALLVARMIM